MKISGISTVGELRAMLNGFDDDYELKDGDTFVEVSISTHETDIVAVQITISKAGSSDNP